MPSKFRGLKLSGRTAAHLKSMLRTQVTQLIKYERIETTVQKAKLIKRFAEKMVTLGKKGEKRHYVQASAFVRERKLVDKLFTEFAERYRDRDGGYTRVLRTRVRKGDNAQMAYIEYVDREGEIRKPRPPKSESEKQALRERLRKELESGNVVVAEEHIPEMGDIPDEFLVEETVEDAVEEIEGVSEEDNAAEDAVKGTKKD
eukprot:CAMPEP_0184489098 /NCGR_PEP_ID=MMETSP0113_2-20130426/14404_1 /TAXON_ID=91329 /ORGANISM="Norrisiella sphaerica, Strain BC52" /LENGTH=201 /DNA_ID=CAMNT_0026872321 /DNA_START=55 /DNA_END=660 /DNA_ORIENTATION=-